MQSSTSIMKMNLDSFYGIGNAHDVNEDYATTGIIANKHIFMVSDGCSASEDVDFGCRFNCKNALKALRDFDFKKSICADNDTFYTHFRHEIAYYSDFVRKSLDMPKSSLDASLVIGITNGELIRVFFYGDGYVFLKLKDDNVRIIRVTYTNNAPLYPSYFLQEERLESYLEEFKGHHKNVTIFSSKEKLEVTTEHDLLKPLMFTFDVKDIITCCVTSDGFGSFTMKGIQQLNDFDMMCGALDFKNYAGQYILRRMKSFHRDIAHQEVRHEDDISVAGVHFIEGV